APGLGILCTTLTLSQRHMLSITFGSRQAYTTLATFPTLRAPISCHARGGEAVHLEILNSFVEDNLTPYPPWFRHMGPWTGGQSVMSSGYGPCVARCPERQGFVVIYAHVTMLELETPLRVRTRCTRQTTTAQSAKPR